VTNAEHLLLLYIFSGCVAARVFGESGEEWVTDSFDGFFFDAVGRHENKCIQVTCVKHELLED
jgi:hypothetical protein